MFDTTAYVLAWPPAVLRHELAWLVRQDRVDVDAAESVLGEAFATEEPLEAFRQLDESSGVGAFGGVGDPWAPTAQPLPAVGPPRDRRALLQQLHDQADALPQRRRPRPYWRARHGQGPVSAPPLESAEQRLGQAMSAWVDVVGTLEAKGYLAQAASRPCVDDEDPPPEPDGVLAALLENALGVADLWPLRPGEWDEATFYSLVEAVGDLLARPRHRTWHNWNRCGWHYSAFAVAPARLLYRSLVDDILARAGSSLRLAAEGEDAGRLVRTSGDQRDEVLVAAALVTPDAGDRAAVEHAVALFRARAAGREDKRSAVVALARLLEDRRALLKAELLRKDEGALFQIANEFDVRHREARQRADYDEAFLEWVFWWYLATLELTDRLLARQGGTP